MAAHPLTDFDDQRPAWLVDDAAQRSNFNELVRRSAGVPDDADDADDVDLDEDDDEFEDDDDEAGEDEGDETTADTTEDQ